MNLDFFSPIVPENEQHANFKRINTIITESFIDSFNQISRGYYDKDGDIVKKFQTQFNPALWEIYLHGVFKTLGMKAIEKYASPDFVFNDVIVEAVIASNTSNKIGEWETNWKDMAFFDLHSLNMQSIIRYTNSISKKYNLYLNKYSKNSYVLNKPFVIALGSFDQPFFHMEYDRGMLPVAYGLYTDENANFDGDIAYQHGNCPVKHMKHILNHNNSRIDLGLFTNEGMKWLSAIIFSCTATISKFRINQIDEKNLIVFEGQFLDEDLTLHNIRAKNTDFPEELVDGLQVYHNPFAVNPLNCAFLDSQGITHYTYNTEYGYFERHINERSLVMRNSKVFILKT